MADLQPDDTASDKSDVSNSFVTEVDDSSDQRSIDTVVDQSGDSNLSMVTTDVICDDSESNTFLNRPLNLASEEVSQLIADLLGMS